MVQTTSVPQTGRFKLIQTARSIDIVAPNIRTRPEVPQTGWLTGPSQLSQPSQPRHLRHTQANRDTPEMHSPPLAYSHPQRCHRHRRRPSLQGQNVKDSVSVLILGWAFLRQVSRERVEQQTSKPHGPLHQSESNAAAVHVRLKLQKMEHSHTGPRDK